MKTWRAKARIIEDKEEDETSLKGLSGIRFGKVGSDVEEKNQS